MPPLADIASAHSASMLLSVLIFLAAAALSVLGFVVARRSFRNGWLAWRLQAPDQPVGQNYLRGAVFLGVAAIAWITFVSAASNHGEINALYTDACVSSVDYMFDNPDRSADLASAVRSCPDRTLQAAVDNNAGHPNSHRLATYFATVFANQR